MRYAKTANIDRDIIKFIKKQSGKNRALSIALAGKK